MNKSKHKLRQVITGKWAVFINLLSLKLKNYLTPMMEQTQLKATRRCLNYSSSGMWKLMTYITLGKA